MPILQNSLLTDKKSVLSKHLGEYIIDLGRKTFKIPKYFTFRWAHGDDDHAARPDLVSQMMYDTDIYGDIIAKLNGYGNPFEFSDDDSIIIPEIIDIPSFFFNGDDDLSEESHYEPKQKKKNDKRTPNQSVVGDTRFKIDKANKIVIY